MPFLSRTLSALQGFLLALGLSVLPASIFPVGVLHAATGDLDTAFATAGKLTAGFGAGNDAVNAMAIQADGKLLMAGSSEQPTTGEDVLLVRYSASGVLDSTFGTAGIVTTPVSNHADAAKGLVVQTDGKIVVTGYACSDASCTNSNVVVVRYLADGTLDSSFSGDGQFSLSVGAIARGIAVAVQSDNKLVIAGESSANGAYFETLLLRLQVDGALDTSFGVDGYLVDSTGGARALLAQADGRIVVANAFSSNGLSMTCYTYTGSRDSLFGASGEQVVPVGNWRDKAFALAVQSDGKYILAGETEVTLNNKDFALARLFSDGVLDSTFDTDGKLTTAVGAGNDRAIAVFVQGDGKLLVGGTTDEGFAVVRYNSAGAIDTTFATNGKVIVPVGVSPMQANAMKVNEKGHLFLAGTAGNGANNDVAAVAILPDLDTDNDGYLNYLDAFASNGAEWIDLDKDGIGDNSDTDDDGDGLSDSEDACPRLAFLDCQFGENGVLKHLWQYMGSASSVVLQADGKRVVMGEMCIRERIYSPCGSRADRQLFLERYLADGALDNTFGSNGRVVVSVGAGSSQLLVQQSDGNLLVAWGRSSATAAVLIARYSPDGALDMTFGNSGLVQSNSVLNVRAIIEQADGRIVLAGVGSTEIFRMVRFNSNGSLDTGFGSGGVVTRYVSDGGSGIYSLTQQFDGKLVAAGFGVFTEVYGTCPSSCSYYTGEDFLLMRFNLNGTLDTTFDGDGMVNTDVVTLAYANRTDYVHSVIQQQDGKLVAAGYIDNGTNRHDMAFTRYNLDGSLDTTFSGDGRLIVSVGTGIDEVNYLVQQADGKLLAAGFGRSNSSTEPGEFTLLRLLADGTVDASFAGDGKLPLWFGQHESINAIAIQSDGKVLAVGTSYGGSYYHSIVARYSYDPDADGDGVAAAADYFPADNARSANEDRDSDGVLTVVDNCPTIVNSDQANTDGDSRGNACDWDDDNDTYDDLVDRFPLDGSDWVDADNDGVGDNADIDDDNDSVADTSDNCPNYYQADQADDDGDGIGNPCDSDGPGKRDTTFINTADVNNSVYDLIVQPDQKIVLAGSLVRRVLANGSQDSSFGSGVVSNNQIIALALQPDGKIIIGGNFSTVNGQTYNRIARVNPDSSIDTAFNVGTGASDAVHAMALQPDGKILLAGEFSTFNGVTSNRIARLNADGSRDTGFSPPVINNGFVYALQLLPSGKFLAGGDFNYVNGVTKRSLARFNSDGSLDSSFDIGTGSTGAIHTIAVDRVGKVVIGGSFTQVNGIARKSVARLHSGGSLDTSFNPGIGPNNLVANVLLQPDGKVIIGGYFKAVSGVARNYIARLNSDGLLDQGFNVGSGADNSVTSMALYPDGKLLLGGNFSQYNNDTALRLVRIYTGDDDNDGIGNAADELWLDPTESVDNDMDGIGNNADTDDDNDGVADVTDAFPFNVAESQDTDGDGTGNNADTDDDNDGVVDTSDAFPLNAAESVDTDNDGTGNNADTDDDNDGVVDTSDAFPLNAAESVDTDHDGVGNNTDKDDDNDGVVDTSDAYPLNAAAASDVDADGLPGNWNAACNTACQVSSGLMLDNCPSAANVDQLNTDGDTQGNVCDSDDDNDGVVDTGDAFPLDAAESVDTDNDGTGNNADTDDDNDGESDVSDNCPSIPNADQLDTDGDTQGDVCDTDDDNDGVVDGSDAFPLNAAESVDTDNDGVGNNADTDDDGDGTADVQDASPLLPYVDGSFGTNGVVITPFAGVNAFGKVAMPTQDGGVLVAGYTSLSGAGDAALARYSSTGQLDSSFGSNGKTTVSKVAGIDYIDSAVLQADGKTVLVGYANTGVNEDAALMRLDANGMLDSSFSGDGWLTFAFGSNVDRLHDVLLQPDGKLVVAGEANLTGSQVDFALARINPDGTLDTTFSGDGKVVSALNGARNDWATALALQADGRILVAGLMLNSNSKDIALQRLDSTGALDTSFTPYGKLVLEIPNSNEIVTDVMQQADGKVLVVGRTEYGSGTVSNVLLARFLSNGTIDTAFGSNGLVNKVIGTRNSGASSVIQQADGKLLVSGFYHDDNNIARPVLMRFLLDGNLDTSFANGGMLATPFVADYAYTWSLSMLPSGRVMATGHARVNGADSFMLLRYQFSADSDGDGFDDYVDDFPQDATQWRDTDADGIGDNTDNCPVFASLDQTDSDADAQGDACDTDDDNDTIADIHDRCPLGSPCAAEIDVYLDPAFGNAGRVLTGTGTTQSRISGALQQADGKVVVAGSMGTDDTHRDAMLARYNSDGSADTTFGSTLNGRVVFATAGDDAHYTVARQADGKLVTAGEVCSWIVSGQCEDYNSAIVRYNSDGTLDSTFGSGGMVSLDTASAAYKESLRAITVQADGKIVAAGYTCVTYDPGAKTCLNYDTLLLRLNSNGSLDGSFATGGIAVVGVKTYHDQLLALALQADGKLVAAGRTCDSGSCDDYNSLVMRFNTNGTLDTTFATAGIGSFDTGPNAWTEQVNALQVQTDGKLVAAGYTCAAGAPATCSNTDMLVMRLNSNGTQDTGFAVNGVSNVALDSGNDVAHGLALSADGSIWVAGYADNATESRFALMHLSSTGQLDTSFSEDGKHTSWLQSHNTGSALVQQTDGKLVLAGYSHEAWASDTTDRIALVRYAVSVDNDGDGVLNSTDAFPNDPAESVDTDNDGIGNNADLDDDGDNVPDYIDADPLDSGVASEIILPMDGRLWKGSQIHDAAAPY